MNIYHVHVYWIVEINDGEMGFNAANGLHFASNFDCINAGDNTKGFHTQKLITSTYH